MTTDPATQGAGSPPDPDPDPCAPRPEGSPAPYLLLVGAAALAVGLAAGIGPIRDIDSYWHIVLGREILDGVAPALAGRGWSFAPIADTWVSTQWLAETLLAWLDSHGGLRSLLVYRAVSTMLVLLTLWLVTVHRRPVRAGAWLFAAGAVSASLYSQERSQQLTFLLAPIVGWWIERAWRSGRLPLWWVVVPLVVVWSNYHGGWVILPLGLGLAAAARALDHGWRDVAARRSLVLAVVTTLAAAVSPSGPANVVAALRFNASTTRIQEWIPLQLWDWLSLPLVLLLGVAVISWARGRVRPSRGELALVLTMLLGATSAWRTMTPVVLMLAPILTGTLARALGLADPAPESERPALRRTSLALAAVGALVAVLAALIQVPVVPPEVPLTLVERIRAAAPQRVLNDYNIAGPLLYFGGPPPAVTVGIDGRADRYGAAYIASYHDGLMNGRQGWEEQVAGLSPTCALLRSDTALPELLVRALGWVVVEREGDWVLLRAPGAAGWSGT